MVDWTKIGRIGANALGDIGYGLTQGTNLQQSLAAAGQRTQAMEAPRAAAEVQAKAEQERRAAIETEQQKANQTAMWLAQKGQTDLAEAIKMGAMSGGDAFKTYLARAQGADPVKGITIGSRLVNPMTGEVMADFTSQDGTSADLSLQPTWGYDANGKLVLGQLGKDGVFHPTALPDGMTPMDPRTLSAERAAGSQLGKEQGQAVFDLPQAEYTAATTKKELDQLLEGNGIKEQFGNVLGIPQQFLPAWPGTPKANFQVRLNQAQGRAFLQAYEMLRGGGQITEVEGKKAEQAMARLSTAQSEAEFRTAVSDFKDAIDEGLRKLRQQAGAAPNGASPQSTNGVIDYTTYFGKQ